MTVHYMAVIMDILARRVNHSLEIRNSCGNRDCLLRCWSDSVPEKGSAVIKKFIILCRMKIERGFIASLSSIEQFFLDTGLKYSAE